MLLGLRHKAGQCGRCWDVICFCPGKATEYIFGFVPVRGITEWPPQDSNSSPDGTKRATKRTLVLISNPREATL